MAPPVVNADIPKTAPLDIGGSVPEHNEVALVAYADADTVPVKSLQMPIFKCSGVVSAREALKAREVIQKRSPVSRCPIVLRRTNRWFRLPLTEGDDPLEGEIPNDPVLEQILAQYLAECREQQAMVARETSKIRKGEHMRLTPNVEPTTSAASGPSDSTAFERVEQQQPEEEQPQEAKPEEPEAPEEQPEEPPVDPEQAEFERQVQEMMHTDGKVYDSEENVDRIRPGMAGKQQFYSMLHIETEKHGGAVAIVGGFATEQEADMFTGHKCMEVKWANATYGDIGKYMPMPPSEFCEKTVHHDPEADRMFSRIAEKTKASHAEA